MSKFKNEIIKFENAILEIINGTSKFSDFHIINFEEYEISQFEDEPIGNIKQDLDIIVIKRTKI